MATKKKMLQAAAGSATGGAALDITDVFSTYLYEGNGSTQTITNDIDLAGEGGLVWIKSRSAATVHNLMDTERGSGFRLFSDDASGQLDSADFNNFLSDGFSLDGNIRMNVTGDTFASWTFRKAPKFFEIVTYTGDGNTSQTISHNLGSTPGHMVVKPFSRTGNWRNYHRTIGATGCLFFNLTNATSTTVNHWNNTEPTDSSFTVGINSNLSGESYVAYLFAHNDGDGEFGPDGDQDIIKCGSYTGTSSAGLDVDLGFEPQWLMVKNADGFSDWNILDVMRGFPVGSQVQDYVLAANTSGAEAGAGGIIDPTPTGFKVTTTWSGVNQSGQDYIYMAIRRGPLAPPESGTEVFAIDTGVSSVPTFISGFPVDMGIFTGRNAGNNYIKSRITGDRYLLTNATGTEATNVSYFDNMDGWENNLPSTYLSWMWKRAPGFFDAVAYTGDGTAGRTVSHNLGVAPEMMWVKSRSLNGGQWVVYHSGLNVNGEGNPETDYIRLNDTAAAADLASMWNDTAPTSSVFSLGNFSWVNSSSNTFIAYLFASLPGISKVGSYSGNGSSQTIDCGFTSGARFVLIKRTDIAGNWHVWDTERGIVSGNDPWLELNTTDAENTSYDSIDPHSSGFTVNEDAGTGVNFSSGSYIFYAIA